MHWQSNMMLTLFACALVSCRAHVRTEQAAEHAHAVSPLCVTSELFSEMITSFGTVTYNSKNDVTSLESGTLVYFPINEGDFVRAGQVIARLKNVQLEFQKEQYENALESARASLAVAKNELREEELAVESRIISLEKSALAIMQRELELEAEQETLRNKTELNQIGGVTDAALKQLRIQEKSSQTELAILKKEREIACLGLRDVDLIDAGYAVPEDAMQKKQLLVKLNTKSTVTKIEALQAEVRNAETSLAAINKLIDELTIHSPITGIVGAKQYENGEYVEQNKSIATIMDTSSVFAVVYIQEKDAVNYALGSEIDIELPSLNKTIRSIISEISPIADPQSGNFSVKAAIQNSDGAIKPGMFVKCSLQQKGTAECCKMPASALVSNNGGTGTVFCVHNNFAVLKTVAIAAQKDGYVWISSGLRSGETVIDNPSPFLKEGQSVYW